MFATRKSFFDEAVKQYEIDANRVTAEDDLAAFHAEFKKTIDVAADYIKLVYKSRSRAQQDIDYTTLTKEISEVITEKMVTKEGEPLLKDLIVWFSRDHRNYQYSFFAEGFHTRQNTRVKTQVTIDGLALA